MQMLGTFFNQRIRGIRHGEGSLGPGPSPEAGARLSPRKDSQELWSNSECLKQWDFSCIDGGTCPQTNRNVSRYSASVFFCAEAEDSCCKIVLRKVISKGTGGEKHICKASPRAVC